MLKQNKIKTKKQNVALFNQKIYIFWYVKCIYISFITQLTGLIEHFMLKILPKDISISFSILRTFKIHPHRSSATYLLTNSLNRQILDFQLKMRIFMTFERPNIGNKFYSYRRKQNAMMPQPFMMEHCLAESWVNIEQAQDIFLTNTNDQFYYIAQSEIKQKSNKMESRFNFSGVDYFTNYNFEHYENQALNVKQRNVPETATNEDDFMFQTPFYQKSTQNLTGAYEISFQGNYMGQHAAVFRTELQNYMESVRIQLQKYEPTILKRFPDGLYNLKTNMTCEELIMMGGIQLSSEKKNKFTNDLKTYDKLQEFLNIVTDQCPSEIAIELIQISQQILEEFLGSEHKDNVYVESSSLLEIASSKSRRLQNVNILNLNVLSKSSERSELLKKYQRFIDVYCATTILVIGQFFENPFNKANEVDGFKRPLNSFSSEEEEESVEKFETSRKKKRKFSF